KIAAELNEAIDALIGEGTSGARLAAGLRRIERQAQAAGPVLTLVAEALERVLAETDTARARIEEALTLTAFEPKGLERTEERLFALRGLARKRYERLALDLSKARAKAAQRLDKEVMVELGPLKLDKAGFITNIETVSLTEGGPSGVDRVAFFVRTNPGTEPGPLMKVASGGELARFILAVKVVLAARRSAPTLVFDED